MEKRKKLKNQIIKFIKTVNSHHTGAYAAQAAYFFVLSLIPIILLLLAMVQYLDRFTEVTLNDVLNTILPVLSSQRYSLLLSAFPLAQEGCFLLR